MDDAIAHREGHAPHLPNIDFVTEFPKPKNMKKGQPLGEILTIGELANMFEIIVLMLYPTCLFGGNLFRLLIAGLKHNPSNVTNLT